MSKENTILIFLARGGMLDLLRLAAQELGAVETLPFGRPIAQNLDSRADEQSQAGV